MKLNSKHIYIRPFTQEDARDLLTLQLENREFFKKFSYERPEDFYTLETQQNRINQFQTDSQNDEAYQFGIFASDGSLLGTINLFQVMRGSLQSAFIGYFLDKKQNGKGYTTEAVKLLTNYAFEELNLHRIEAGVMPHNIGSIRVLEKAGYHKEGLAVSNVRINGEWKDHQVLAIINPKDVSAQGDIPSQQKTVEMVPVDGDNRQHYFN